MPRSISKMYTEVIAEEVQESGLTLDKGNAKYRIRGVGFAGCRGPCGGKEWTSQCSYAVIDLKKTKLVKRWQQKCNRCETPVIMNFAKKHFRDMVCIAIERQRAVESGDRGRSTRSRGKSNKKGPPHDSKRCELCGWGKWKCWLGGRNQGDSDDEEHFEEHFAGLTI